jgi:hypothetical protein
LGPRFRGDDAFGWTAGFLHSLEGRYLLLKRGSG